MKLKPSGYATASESSKPGYLKRRFAQIRAELRAKAERERANQAEAQSKTLPMPKKARAA